MKFELINDLIIVELQSKKILLNTGSTLSFSLKDDFSISINDRSYSLRAHSAASKVKTTLSHLIPHQDVDGIIGTDIISKTNLTIDYLNREVYFDICNPQYIEEYTLPLSFEKGLVFISIPSGNNQLKMVLESGTKQHYIKSKYLDMTQTCGDFEDYSPDLGRIYGPSYKFYDSIHNEKLYAGVLPKEYDSICDGILGLHPFVHPGYCIFDFKNRVFVFSRRFI